MKTREIEVADLKGHFQMATLVMCDCNWDTFRVYVVENHQHMQCVACATVYCDGTCDEIPEKP